MAKFNIREQDPQKYSAVKAEQDKLSAICGVQMKIARICPYCGHTVSIVYKETIPTRRKNAANAARQSHSRRFHSGLASSLSVLQLNNQ